MSILVLCGTSEGQTRKIGTFVADQLRLRGQQVTLRNVEDQPRDARLLEFDGVIVAARVHAGTYQRQITDFASQNRLSLLAMQTAFLSVSMSAACLRPGDMEAAELYVEKFEKRTGWSPDRVLHVAGARLYTRHNFIGRWILGIVDGKMLDTSRDYEWTNWKQLEGFVAEFISDVQTITASADQEATIAAGP